MNLEPDSVLFFFFPVIAVSGHIIQKLEPNCKLVPKPWKNATHYKSFITIILSKFTVSMAFITA